MKNELFPVLLDDSVVDELATLYQAGLLTGQDIDDDLLEAVINSNQNEASQSN